MEDNALDVNSFKVIYDDYFDQLRSYIYYRCGDEALASDIAQEAFLKLWEQRDRIIHETTLHLLYTIAKNMHNSICRHNKIILEFRQKEKYRLHQINSENEFFYNESKKNYEIILSQMPELNREVFLMSRMDELKYKEISQRLDISVKAVEKRMSKALSYLKQQLLHKI